MMKRETSILEMLDVLKKDRADRSGLHTIQAAEPNQIEQIIFWLFDKGR